VTDPAGMLTERELLAAELALGLLDPSERAQALRLRLADAEFAGLAAKWEQRAASWYIDLPDQPVPDQMWLQIAAKLDARSSADPAQREGSGGSATGWRLTAVAASMAALVFAGMWAFAPRRPAIPDGSQMAVAERHIAPGALSVAEIPQGATGELVSAVYDRRTGQLLLRLAPLDEPGRVPVLWVIGNDGTPRSLGELVAGRSITLKLAPEVRRAFDQGAAIAVSLEDPVGPFEAPQGPILGKADLHRI
jgi:anti-sigma-K factor RskA